MISSVSLKYRADIIKLMTFVNSSNLYFENELVLVTSVINRIAL